MLVILSTIGSSDSGTVIVPATTGGGLLKWTQTWNIDRTSSELGTCDSLGFKKTKQFEFAWYQV